MKQLLSKVSLLFIAGVLTLTSCEKDDPKPSGSSGNTNTDSNEYYTAGGSAEATLSGTIDGYSNYDGQAYTIDKSYTFLQDDLNYASNTMTTKRYYNANGSYDYNEYTYIIRMYATSGQNHSSYSLNDYIEISFKYYTGILSNDALEAGVELNKPQQVTLNISATYNPENTIDIIPLDGYYTYDTDYFGGIYTYDESVNISDFVPADASGKVSFSFSTSGIHDILIQNGTVSTTMLYNEILEESKEGTYNPDPEPTEKTSIYEDSYGDLYTYDLFNSISYVYYDGDLDMYYYYDSFLGENVYLSLEDMEFV